MTRVKICGITNLEDALLCVEAGADALGFNFYEKSPRYISPVQASKISAKLPTHISTIGVFVNSSLVQIETILTTLPLRFAQLHGDESPEFVSRVRAVTDTKIIKVFRVSADFQPSIASDYEADQFMLDTDSRYFGGSGETFDWKAAIEFKKFAAEFYVAGGLNPDNVSEAVRKVTPYAVDVCSGVESVKGRKDRFKVEAFVRNAKK